MKGPLIYYEIKDTYGTDLSSTKLASELRQSVLDDLDLGFNVELDFKGVRSISRAWGRNFIGLIAKEKGYDFVKDHILLSNMSKSVQTTLLEGTEDAVA